MCPATILRKSPGRELGLLRVLISQQLIINRDSSFPAEATVGEWFGGSLCIQSACISVIRSQEHGEAHPALAPRPALSPVTTLAFLYPRGAPPFPNGLLCSRRWVRLQPGPGAPSSARHQARGGAGPRRPALAVEGPGSVTPGHPGSDFYLCAAGRREEETPHRGWP